MYFHDTHLKRTYQKNKKIYIYIAYKNNNIDKKKK